MTVTLEPEGPRRTRWKLVTRFASMAERDTAGRIGFATVIAEGTEKLNDLLLSLSAQDARSRR